MRFGRWLATFRDTSQWWLVDSSGIKEAILIALSPVTKPFVLPPQSLARWELSWKKPKQGSFGKLSHTLNEPWLTLCACSTLPRSQERQTLEEQCLAMLQHSTQTLHLAQSLHHRGIYIAM